MTIEEQKPEQKPEEKQEKQEKQPEVSSTSVEKNIEVDVFGVKIDIPLSKAKELISKRDTKIKEYSELKSKITEAENQARQEAEKANLLALMKSQDAAAVEEAVSQKYKDTIARFEKKVFGSEVKVALSSLGVLPEALEDAAKLVFAETKAELIEDAVKLNGVPAAEYLKGWIEKKPHLVAVKKAATGLGGKPPTKVQASKPSGLEAIRKGLEAFSK